MMGKIDGEFKRISAENNTSQHLDAVAFYKLLMTLSNLHSTVHSFYSLIGEDSHSQYHETLSKRFFTDAQRLKNLKIDSAKLDKRKDH